MRVRIVCSFGSTSPEFECPGEAVDYLLSMSTALYRIQIFRAEESGWCWLDRTPKFKEIWERKGNV